MFVDHEGQQTTAAGLVQSIQSDPTYREFVVQEKLRNHPAIAGLSSGGLLSLRVITYVPPDACPRALTANLKAIVGRNIVSNSRHGTLGNLTAEVDLSTGRIVDARALRQDGKGFVIVPQHPDTGVTFAGWPVPCLEESLDLARKAARVFLPVRTVGWDVAATPDGPRLLEGNIWYDPPNHCVEAASVMATMREPSPA
jgi:hypothetical protein